MFSKCFLGDGGVTRNRTTSRLWEIIPTRTYQCGDEGMGAQGRLLGVPHTQQKWEPWW